TVEREPRDPDIDARVRQEITAHRIAEALLALRSPRPIAFFIDDLDTVETLSINVLRAVARAPRGPGHDSSSFVVIASSCDDREDARAVLERFAPDARDNAGEKASVEAFLLEPLTSVDVERFLHRLLGEDAEIAQDLPERLRESSTGRPLFLEESVRLLVDSGRIERRRGRWRADEIDVVPVARSLPELARSRIARLDDLERAVLGRAAILGRFTAKDVRKIDRIVTEDRSLPPLPKDIDLDAVLSRATRDGLLERTGTLRAFRHESLRA